MMLNFGVKLINFQEKDDFFRLESCKIAYILLELLYIVIQISILCSFMVKHENAPRTTGGRSAHRISLLYQKSLFFTPNASDDASRTTGGGFCAPHAYSVPQEAFSGTECAECQKRRMP